MTAGAERRSGKRPVHEARHQSREAAVQMLYQWEIGRTPMEDVAASFWEHGPASAVALPEAHRLFASRLANGVAKGAAGIDPMIAEAAEHWRVERMNVMDRLILRLAVYEFLQEPETPARVVINEALELARTYSTDEAVGFINGILDAIRRKLERE